MRPVIRLLPWAAVLLFCPHLYSFQGSAPASTPPEKVRVVPGARYEAGWLHRLFLGAHWRDLWTTPVDIELLDLHHFAGGLTPVAPGGGRETRSLKFRGADGKEYKFRSIDKDPTAALTPDLRQSIAADFVQDQISSANPFSALVAAPLLDAVGVLNAGARAVVLPNDGRLGEFQQEFGGQLGTFEEKPTVESDREAGFGGADKIIGTDVLYRRLEEDHDEQVDAREFLKARLMDIYLGDWDRHAGQWSWAGYKEGRRWIWKPIPRDRDQAFSRFDGVIPTIGEKIIPEVEGFDDHYNDIEDLTWTGRYLDRHFLVSMDKPVFDSMTTFIVERLTDSVIEHAVRRLPPEIYTMGGPSLERMLKLRREKLPSASEEYYSLLSRFPDIRASGRSEYAEIHRLDDHRVEVALYKRDKSKGRKKGDSFYDRVFDDKYTKDIRLYLGGGDDLAVVDGEVENSITVRIIGGDGHNAYLDSSIVRGKFLSLFPHASTMTCLYDTARDLECSLGPSSSLNQDPEPPVENDSLKFEPAQRDYGHSWWFAPWYGFSPEDGVFLGGGPILYDYGFRAAPYVSRMELRGGYAWGVKKFRFDYKGEFFTLVRGARVLLSAAGSQLERLNFFGLGNETPIDMDLSRNRFYEVEQSQIMFRPTIDFQPVSGVTLALGGAVNYVHTYLKAGSLLDQVQPYGSQKKIVQANALGSITVDTRDNVPAPHRGGLLSVEGSYFPQCFDNDYPFGKMRSEARAYFSTDAITEVTLALRAAAEKIWGTYPFFESSFIGGARTVRGFELQRFAGDASVFGNAELRVRLGKFIFLFPGTYGISFFGEAGRVYLSGESSNRWHASAGGGFWFSVIRPEYTLSTSIAHSEEKNGVYIAGGFMF